MCTLTSVMTMTSKDPVGCARDLQWQTAKPLPGLECRGSHKPANINGADAQFPLCRAMPKQLTYPKHFLMTLCPKGQA